MSLRSQTEYVVAIETVKVAHAVFPKGNLCLTMADILSEFINDDTFNELYAVKGQPGAYSPNFGLLGLCT